MSVFVVVLASLLVVEDQCFPEVFEPFDAEVQLSQQGIHSHR